ncbi:hypothetical protein LzC2_27890 [Planctomycetes bacterium LzC2]|uniref:Uncharacterized protein n=1 Tax=Alienimonas chondri TaxID=2681879 RepID=A0ABX1VF15_9PLAN|nr:hypothetical protein [Alienimonas chondri]
MVAIHSPVMYDDPVLTHLELLNCVRHAANVHGTI